jgi:hypothetical protein
MEEEENAEAKAEEAKDEGEVQAGQRISTA